MRSSDLFGQNKTPLSLTRRFFKGLKVGVVKLYYEMLLVLLDVALSY